MSAALEILSWGLILAGSGFCVVGALGLVRLKGFYARTHAASVIDSAGGGVLLPPSPPSEVWSPTRMGASAPFAAIPRPGV